MKPPTVRIKSRLVQLWNREHVVRAYATFSAIMIRLVPIIIFALIFTQIAVYLDQAHYRKAPATDFLNYTAFNVNNARVGDDVFFKVCRTHTSNIRYTGNLNVYVITNPDQKNPHQIKVFGHTLGGIIDNDCENKVIPASEFKHAAGTYVMSFCVDFTVKYGYQKEVCKTSNIYSIYPQPTDLESQITSLQKQLDAAQAQLKDSQGANGGASSSSMTAPGQSSQGGTSGGTSTTGGKTGSGGGTSGTGVVPPTCAASVLGVGLACGSGGLLHL